MLQRQGEYRTITTTRPAPGCSCCSDLRRRYADTERKAGVTTTTFRHLARDEATGKGKLVLCEVQST